MNQNEKILHTLANQTFDCDIQSITPLREHGSARKIYRIHIKDEQSIIGVINNDSIENNAFIQFSTVFHQNGLNVPEVLSVTDDNIGYLQTDLGDTTLMDIVQSYQTGDITDENLISFYQSAIDHLILFQTQGMTLIDTAWCYQGSSFDGMALKKDVDSFCQDYLQRVDLWDFDDDLSDDVKELITASQQYDPGYFMYRDFQSRNIMITDNGLYFIDYQSGREGPLQYDIASLLFQSKANLSPHMRETLFDYYMHGIDQHLSIDTDDFKARYMIFVLIRILQVLGAYGKLGLGHSKAYFKNSIPYALGNCQYIMDNWPNDITCKTLRQKLEKAIETDVSNII
jgi:aminoglycoside/choline kinase family phosphotransferase